MRLMVTWATSKSKTRVAERSRDGESKPRKLHENLVLRSFAEEPACEPDAGDLARDYALLYGNRRGLVVALWQSALGGDGESAGLELSTAGGGKIL